MKKTRRRSAPARTASKGPKSPGGRRERGPEEEPGEQKHSGNSGTAAVIQEDVVGHVVALPGILVGHILNPIVKIDPISGYRRIGPGMPPKPPSGKRLRRLPPRFPGSYADGPHSGPGMECVITNSTPAAAMQRTNVDRTELKAAARKSPRVTPQRQANSEGNQDQGHSRIRPVCHRCSKRRQAGHKEHHGKPNQPFWSGQRV